MSDGEPAAAAAARGDEADEEHARPEPASAFRAQSKRWMVTVFDDTWEPEWIPAHCDYMVWQRETTKTGRIHVHVYLRFKSRKRYSTVKTFLGRNDAHCEPARGTEQQCKDYCTKDESRVQAGEEHGTFVPTEGKQGARSDLDDIAEECKKGTPLAEIAASHPGDFIRYHSGISALHLQIAPPPPAVREVSLTVFWGDTGLGKTHRVLTMYPEIYLVKPGRDPWGMYRGQSSIFFDEFDPDLWKIQDMNRFLDKWRCMLDSRYQDRYAAWTKVFIASNLHPISWWQSEPNLTLLRSIRRRLSNTCYHVTARETPLEALEQTPTWDENGNGVAN